MMRRAPFFLTIITVLAGSLGAQSFADEFATAEAAARAGRTADAVRLFAALGARAAAAGDKAREHEALYFEIDLRLRREPWPELEKRLLDLERALGEKTGDPLAPRIAARLASFADALDADDGVRDARHQAAAALIPAEPDRARRAVLAANLAASLRVEGDDAGYAKLIASAAADAEAAKDDKALAAVALTRAEAAYVEGAEAVVQATEEALSHAEKSGDALFLTTYRISTSWLFLWAGESERAAAVLTRALDDAAARGDRADRAHALFRLGALHADKGELAEALARFKEARALFEELGMATAMSAAASEYADTANRIGIGPLATEELRAVVAAANGRHPTKLSIRNEKTLAALLLDGGRLGEAAAIAARALGRAEELGDRLLSDEVRLVRAAAALAVGRTDDALADARQALADFADAKNDWNTRLAADLEARAVAARTDDPAAEGRELAELIRRERSRLPADTTAGLLLRAAALGIEAGDHRAAGELLREARELAKAADAKPVLLRADLLSAKIALREGRYAASTAIADGTAEAARAAGDPAVALEADLVSGIAAARRGDAPVADRRFTAAFGSIDRACAMLFTEEADAIRAAANEAWETAIAMHWRATDVSPEAAARGFTYAEMRRSDIAAATLASPAQAMFEQAAIAPFARLARAREKADAARTALDLAAAAGDATAIRDAALRRDQAAREKDDAFRALRLAAGPSAAPVGEPSLTIADLSAALAEDQRYVAYERAENRLYAIAVGRNRLLVRDLGDADMLARKASAYRRLAGVPGSPDEPLAAELYDALLRPLEPALKDAARIHIAPSAALDCALPIDALRDASHEPPQRVLEKWRIGFVASATALVTALRDAPRGPAARVIAVGDPLYPDEQNDVALRRGGLRRLPLSGDEARGVMALVAEADRGPLLLRGAATRTALLAALGRGDRFRAIHIACHGVIDHRRPRLSGLLLAGGESLTSDDLYGVNANADVAVLSACSSGPVGAPTGIGIFGLVRAFAAARCPRVVVGIGAVDDKAACEFMLAFEKRMLAGKEAPAAALRATKLALLHEADMAAHPSRWASYQYWGIDP